jgi:hypothetical protein
VHRPSLFLLLAALLCVLAQGLAQPMAALRLGHLSPDAPRMDLVVDNQLFLRDVVYGQITTYSALPAGQHEISVFPHRLPNAPPPALEEGGEAVRARALEPITMLIDLDDGEYYTLAISGLYQQPQDGGATGALTIDVDPAEASVQVRGPIGYSIGFAGDRLLEELEPGSYSVRAEHAAYQPASFEVEVRAGETASIAISLQQGDERETTPARPASTAGATSGWRPVELHAFRDDLGQLPPPGGSRVRLLHMSPATRSVDLLAIPSDGGGEPVVLASGLSYPNGSAYGHLPGSEYTLQLRLAGTDAILAEVRNLSIEPGGSYTLFMVREPSDNYLRLIPAVDLLLSTRR